MPFPQGIQGPTLTFTQDDQERDTVTETEPARRLWRESMATVNGESSAQARG